MQHQKVVLDPVSSFTVSLFVPLYVPMHRIQILENTEIMYKMFFYCMYTISRLCTRFNYLYVYCPEIMYKMQLIVCTLLNYVKMQLMYVH